ncbi:YqjF family protein [Verrucomicrobium spinosum]|uniref:YqjF family protein n=1 Tax=Verrucomicrobium spinosum TaxID=2736 RepID=UPI00017443F0|nr:DUF2071 domain-containing protein [Verrucomicrobium spinosum]
MYQTWSHLLFLHWEWDAAAIQRTLPSGLHVDTFGGSAWVGLVPFFMRNIRPRYLPAVPWVSYFLELNVRTYVHDDEGRPGVWFYSLDCNQPLAVWTAQTFFHLPYQHARMTAEFGTGKEIHYRCHRVGAPEGSEFRYQLGATPTLAEPGTLEFFLAERYLLFAHTPRGIFRGQVHHEPYPLVPAQVNAWDDRILQMQGFASPGRPPDHVVGSPGVDVRVYPLQG